MATGPSSNPMTISGLPVVCSISGISPTASKGFIHFHYLGMGLDHGIGHHGCLCTTPEHFSTGDKEHARTPTSCWMFTRGRDGKGGPRSLFGFRMMKSNGRITCSGSLLHRRTRLLCMGASAQCRGNCPKVHTRNRTVRGSVRPRVPRRSSGQQAKVTCGQSTGETGRPAEREVSQNLWQRSQGDRDSWNGLFDTQAGLWRGHPACRINGRFCIYAKTP